MMKHVKDSHGNITCQKFLNNQCSFNSRCLFKHPINIEQNVDQNDEAHAQPTQDFPNTLTMRPVVATQGRSQVQQMPTQDQQLIQNLNIQMISIMNQMNQIPTILAKMKPNPQ